MFSNSVMSVVSALYMSWIMSDNLRKCKPCRDCGKNKPLEEFSLRYDKPRDKSYYRGRCKVCQRTLDNSNTQKKARQNHWNRQNRSSLMKGRWKYHRNTRLRFKYGISEHTYRVLLERQGNKCFFCGIDADTYHKEQNKHLAVDHNHETGKVRGILCNLCNTRLSFVDNCGMKRIEEYLNQPPLTFDLMWKPSALKFP